MMAAMKAVSTLALVGASIVGINAQGLNEVLLSGRSWSKLPIEMKAGYLLGAEDATRLSVVEAQQARLISGSAASKITEAKLISGFSRAEIVQQLDLFFSDTANSLVPVLLAYQNIIKAKLEGATDAELQLRASKLRALAHALETQPRTEGMR
jgi:hypothetical protein